MKKFLSVALLAAAALMPAAAQAEVRITEFMYQGANSGNREFLELTNLGAGAIDITGWSYNDDNPNNPVAFGSFFGLLGAHESIILTEMTPDAFRTYWGLDAGVRVFSIGGNSNMGSSDTLKIYNSTTQIDANLVDLLAYSGTTRGITRNRPVDAVGQVLNSAFVNSASGDVYGSVLAPTVPQDIGNPGRFPFAAAPAVPEPASWAMMIGGFAFAGAAMRRRKAAVRFA